jgi:hypothetical protein
MFELPPDHKENLTEHIPTPEEVLGIFKQLIGEAAFEDRRKLEDEQGLYLWEIKLPEKKGNGSIEYSYIRKGNYRDRGLPGGLSAETVIHIAFFDAGGMPISGYSVAKLADDKWEITP